MVAYTIFMALSLVFLGGAAMHAGSTLLALVCSGGGALLLALVFSTQDRLLRKCQDRG